ncbi:MAG TPA: HlyD family secretion protein [Myxococcales bacterium]|jgi:membrane fusion protein (multidrug efflux system)|nr:HlyD family secretion protein [Myxococcales bacterium]
MAEQHEQAEARKQGNGAERPDAPAQKKENPVEAPKKSNTRFFVMGGLAVAFIAGLLYWLHARHFEDTDDAQIDGYITAVSTRVQGTVVAVHFDDNQEVKQGDIMVELDPADLEVALAQSKAALAQAQAQLQAEQPSVGITQSSNTASLATGGDAVTNADADLEAARRELDQAEANNKFAQQQKARAVELLASKVIPQADYDQRVSAADAAAAAVATAKKRIDQRKATLQSAQSRLVETRANAPRQLVERQANLSVRQANLELAQAQYKQAQLNYSYGKLAAPVSGVLGKRSVNIGDRVQPGQQLFSLSQTGNQWVTANFRETQIEQMKIGQEVEIHVDSLDKDFTGKVQSFAAATGSRYSLLPPENATGNYVKVVQRIPVRISLDPNQAGLERLRPGMSAEPKVRVR